MRITLAASGFATLLILAGCAGPGAKKDTGPAPRTEATARSAPPATGQAPTPPQPKPAAKWGGGYYMDDGPGENPPDLAAVPEPVPRLEPLRRAANKPYSVLGQDFKPFDKLKPYSARGVGSWYGRKFHGQQTSSGERYDMFGMTAAHPTLPIPSYARVTNMENGRSVIVRINDRGPFLRERLIDLSYTAAWKLGYATQGSAPLQVEAIIPGETLLASAAPTPAAVPLPPPRKSEPIQVASAAEDDDPIAAFAREEEEKPVTLPAVATKGSVFLQLASFSSAGNAESFREHLAAELPDAGLRVVQGGGLYRIHLGPYADAPAARAAAERLSRQLGAKPFIVR